MSDLSRERTLALGGLDATLAQIAETVSDIPAGRNYFIESAREAVIEAWRIAEIEPADATAKGATELLQSISGDAGVMINKLRPLVADHKTFSNSYIAMMFYRLTKGPSIAETIATLERLKVALDEAAISSEAPPAGRGRPPGTTARKGFDVFATMLFGAALGAGIKLTIFRDRSGTVWKGSFVSTVERLRPHLPQGGFFPIGSLGQALERIAK